MLSPRQRFTPSDRRPNRFRPGVEALEERLAPAAGLPDIVVGRTLSTYTAGGVQNHALIVTYTVYNEQANDISGVLLNTTLQPGVGFQSASVLPDRNGQELAWSLGTLPAFGRASVTLTVTLSDAVPLQIDGGARAFGTLNAGIVSDTTPAAALTNRTIPADQLASTPDANTTDPFVQGQAAKLDYDPQAIFDYLNSDVGYESYVGSLRGARGTLWSAAGNSLDEASLGVALFRASGIPARYAHGTLSDTRAQQLILSMFPASYQTVGYIPSGTATADPANDPKLLAETRDHYWLQVDTGTGFQNADTSGLPGGGFGTAFTAATSLFTEVADALRQKVRVAVGAETFNAALAAFGFANPLGTTTVLDRTFNAVDLVGKPLTFGFFVDRSGVGGGVLSAVTTTYTPYVTLGDDAFPDPANDELVTGTAFQDLITNFPLGTVAVTGLFLTITLSGDGGPPQTFQRTLADRLGFAARRGGTAPALNLGADSAPIVDSFDLWSLGAIAGTQSAAATIAADRAVVRLLDQIAAAPDDGSNRQSTLFGQLLIAQSRSYSRQYIIVSDGYSADLAGTAIVRAYADRPRLVLFSSAVESVGGTPATVFGVDLLSDVVRVVVSPGQSFAVAAPFRTARGLLNEQVESNVLIPDGEAGIGLAHPVSTSLVMRAAAEQGIAVVSITPQTRALVDTLAVSAEAKARITAALDRGQGVSVPAASVVIGGTSTVAWFEFDPVSGDMVGVLESGTHGFLGETAGLAQVVSILGFIFLPSGIGTLAAGIQFAFIRQKYQGYVDFFSVRLDISSGHIVTINVPLKEAQRKAVARLNQDVAMAKEQGDFIPIEIIGLGIAYKLTLDALYNEFKSRYVPADPNDPPLSGTLFGVPPAVGRRPVVAELPVVASRSAGAVAGTAVPSFVELQGAATVEVSAGGPATFGAATLTAGGATVRAADGTMVGVGAVGLAAGSVAVGLVVDAAGLLSASGTGALSAYNSGADPLRLVGDWDAYTATATGGITLTLTTDRLTLNGVSLPAGRYAITSTSATFAGSGAWAARVGASPMRVRATDATVNLGPNGGGYTISGVALSGAVGVGLTGYTGDVLVAVGASGAIGSVTLSGTARAELQVVPTATAVTADQNTPAVFDVAVRGTVTGTHNLIVSAPVGWDVTVTAAGRVSVRPAPGVQGGSYVVSVFAAPNTDLALLARTDVVVTVSPTAPGLALAVAPDLVFSVPYQGAMVQTSFRASVQNLGPAADMYTLAVTSVPVGFAPRTSAGTVTVPAGETGVVGVSLVPVAGSTLPAPGTVLTFDVTATSTTDPSRTRTVTVTFTMPTVHAVALASTPVAWSTTPGQAVGGTLTLTAVGNLSETVTLTATTSAGLTVSGLPPTVTLAAGQTITLPYTLTPAADTPLNTTLGLGVVADLGSAVADDFNTRLSILLRVAVPGADAIVTASSAAGALGNTDLANRLNDLGLALTNLVQTPTSAVFKSQALASLASIRSLLQVDSTLVSFASPLAAATQNLASAQNAAQVQTAVVALGHVLDGFAETVTALRHHGVEVSLIPNALVAQPGVPQRFGILLHNVGDQTTTYDLTLLGLPTGVTGSFSQTSITLAPGQFSSGLFATLTQTSSTELQAFEFQVRATASGFPIVSKSTPGTLRARAETVSVVSVVATPPFAEGGTVAVSARVLNAVNRQQSAQASFQVRDPNGAVVFTSTPVSLTLSVATSLATVNLGTFDTTGFANGEYTIVVTVADAGGAPIPGAAKDGRVLIGSPVTAVIGAGPETLPPGTGVVTNTLLIDNKSSHLDPPTAVGVAPVAGAADVVRNGDYVYVASTAGISVFNIAGANLNNPQLVRVIGSRTDILKVRGDLLVAIRGGSEQVLPNTTTLTTYSLADPANPQLLGTTGEIPYSVVTDVLLTDTHAFLVIINLHAFFGFTIFSQPGGVVAVDISDPAAPFFDGDAVGAAGTPEGRDGVNDGVLFNLFGTTGDGISSNGIADESGGNQTTWNIAQVSPTIVYVTGSSSIGSDTQTGAGLVRVVDISDPRNMRLLRDLEIPGTLMATAISITGNRAFVLASQGGWQQNSFDHRFTGNAVLATLDISDPANPQVVRTQVLSQPSLGLGRNRIVALSGGLFAYPNEGTAATDPGLYVFNGNGPGNVTSVGLDVPAEIFRLSGGGDLIFTADQSSLIIYQVHASASVPVTARVQVPTNAGVSIVPGSFNIAPTSIVSGPDFDTLVWTTTLDDATPTRTFTWQTTVAALQPGESRPLTLGTSIDFTDAGAPGQVTLPGTRVAAEQILALSPAAQTVRPGQPTAYTLSVANPTAAAVTYALAAQGVPQSWIDLPPQVTVPAGGRVDVPFAVVPDPFAPALDYGFVLTASAGAEQGSVEATLTLLGAPLLTPAQPQSHGVVVEVLSRAATAGQGTSVAYRVRVTNTGSAAETFTLAVTTDLPADVAAALASNSAVIPPGASNFREFVVALTPRAGAPTGITGFTAVATSTTTTGSARGSLTVVANGVDVKLDRATGTPGDTFQVTVTNTGSVADTFDLSTAGPGGLVVALGTVRVTLAAGGSTTVPLTTGPAPFAVQGNLGLTVIARSTGNPAVGDAANAGLQIAATTGLAAHFDPADRTLSDPAGTDFLLLIDNTGNTEGAYSITLTGVTGPVRAWLVGPDGLPTQQISVVRLPGLSSGAVLVRAALSATGTAGVTVEVRSLDTPALVVASTATLRADAVAPPAVPVPGTASPPHLFAVGAGPGDARTGSHVKAFDPDGTLRLSFYAYGTEFYGGVTVATADVNGDGTDDVVTGTATGADHVKVFDGRTGIELASFLAFGGYRGGVTVAAAGGLVAVGAGAGSDPHVKLFRYVDGEFREIASFLAFDAGFVGGVSVGVDGSTGRLVVGAGAGALPHVKVFDANTLSLLGSYLAFDAGFAGGVWVTAHAGLVGVGAGAGGSGHVKMFDGETLVERASFHAAGGDQAHIGGAASPVPLLLVGAGPGTSPRVSVYADSAPRLSFDAFDADFRGGIFVG